MGIGDGQFNIPYGVDVDLKVMFGLLIEIIIVFKNSTGEGNFLLKFGSEGSGDGQFKSPRQVAVDKDLKFVYVADSNNNRIQKFDINGNFIKVGDLWELETANLIRLFL